MPIPKSITGFNRRVLNPILGRLAKRAPSMAILVHRGRRSGRRHETPVLVFTSDDTATIALTYGTDVDWLKNVRVTNGCTLIQQGREYRASNPRMLPSAEGQRRMPALVRLILQLLRVDELVELTLTANRKVGR